MFVWFLCVFGAMVNQLRFESRFWTMMENSSFLMQLDRVCYLVCVDIAGAWNFRIYKGATCFSHHVWEKLGGRRLQESQARWSWSSGNTLAGMQPRIWTLSESFYLKNWAGWMPCTRTISIRAKTSSSNFLILDRKWGCKTNHQFEGEHSISSSVYFILFLFSFNFCT